MSTSNAFEHLYSTLPLSKERAEIRQLILEPPSADTAAESPIVCSLNCLALDDNAQYTALSYVWGPPPSTTKPPKVIELHDQTFPVTDNLYEALLYLRKAQHQCVLWVDAICINQDDTEEKTSQVQFMRRIYQKASEVIIWLGPSSPAIDTAFERIDKLGDALLNKGLWELSVEDIRTWDPADAFTTEPSSRIAKIKRDMNVYMQSLMQLLQKGNNPFTALFPVDLKKRAWFTRAWCLQELANAHIAIFRCGHKEVEYTRFWAAAFFLTVFSTWAARHYRTGNDQVDWRSAEILEDALNMPTMSLGLRRKRLTDPQHPDLQLKRLLMRVNTVKMFDTSGVQIKATLPRDRVYALLGIANDPVAQEILPDYSKTYSVEEVYIDTAKALLRHGALDILALCRERGELTMLPSWVPDWTAMNREPWSGDWEMRWFDAGRTPEGDFVQPKLRFEANGLELSGGFVDDVADIGATWSRGIADPFDYEAAGKLFNDIASFLSRSSRYNDTQKAEALWRIPIGDLESGGAANWPQRATLTAQNGYNAIRRSVENPTIEGHNHGSSHAAFISYMGRMQRMQNSRPFLSVDGYVGLCPIDTEEKDVIVVILGAQVPFVIRKRDDGAWRLVGEAHVVGIMDGEWMTEERVVEQILLR